MKNLKEFMRYSPAAPLVIVLLIFLAAVPFIYIAVKDKEQRESDIASLCESHGYLTNNYSIQSGKSSETVRFCVDSKGVMYWPGALENN